MEDIKLGIIVTQNTKALENNFSKPKLKEVTEAYKLHVKAEALRLSSMHKEAVEKYLQAIFLSKSLVK